jgi:hypothetical protein
MFRRLSPNRETPYVAWLLEAILAIEAEAAAGPQYHTDTGHRVSTPPNECPRCIRDREAAAGPRDGCAYQCPHDKATHERYPNDIDHDYVEAAAGLRDVPTLPPPDLSLIDTLGEGADPDRPVRVK